MLYQLKNLSEEEQSVVTKAPIWVTLLIACSDSDINEDEIDRAKEIIHIKTYTTQNDVQDLYKELNLNLDSEIDQALISLSSVGSERLTFLEDNLKRLNKIFPKLDKSYASQLYNSLRSLALSVAQSEGGFFGIARISEQEQQFLKLPMLDKP
ncbi:MAG: hypothetical protein KJP21_04960 [Bacteroidia bacterium]|nr:hypothetical protein [Bacteroidia bacterium]